MSETGAAAEPPLMLYQWLESMIDRLSDPEVRARLAPTAGYWKLRMCADVREPDASWAEVVCGNNVLMRFAKKPRPDRVQRITEVPFRALLICGELWQDSKAHMPK